MDAPEWWQKLQAQVTIILAWVVAACHLIIYCVCWTQMPNSHYTCNGTAEGTTATAFDPEGACGVVTIGHSIDIAKDIKVNANSKSGNLTIQVVLGSTVVSKVASEVTKQNDIVPKLAGVKALTT